MKNINKILFVFLCVMFLPIMVNAKEKCTVVSGNKTDIGSEIACGSEHFYIVDSNDKETKMLAKYNLNTGVTIHKEKIERTADDTRDDYDYCSDLAASKYAMMKSDGFYNADGYCFYATFNSKKQHRYKYITIDENDTRTSDEICREYAISNNGEYYDSYTYNNRISCSYYIIDDDYNMLQKEDAKSAHWDADLNYLYPQVGDVYMFQNGGAADSNMIFEDGISKNTNPVQPDTGFYDFQIDYSHLSDYDPEETVDYGNYRGITKPLYTYKYLLEKMGYSINDISLLSISELDGIVYKTSNKNLPLKEWGENYDVINAGYNNSAIQATFGDLKPFISKDYSWLYSTTYWNSTVFNDSNNPPHHYTYRNTYFVFTAEQGKLCGAGFQTCAPETTLGCGIRPVITINSEDIVEPPRTIINNPQTGGIAVLVLVGLCGLLFIGRKSLKRFS